MTTMTTGTTKATDPKRGRRWVTGAAVLALLLPLGGCFRHTLDVGAGAPRGEVVYDHWQHFWIGGLVGDTREDVEALCPSGDATIEARQSFLNALVAGLTAGIYMPTTLKIRCAENGRRGDVDLTADEVRQYAESPGLEGWVAANAPTRTDEVRRARAEQP